MPKHGSRLHRVFFRGIEVGELLHISKWMVKLCMKFMKVLIKISYIHFIYLSPPIFNENLCTVFIDYVLFLILIITVLSFHVFV